MIVYLHKFLITIKLMEANIMNALINLDGTFGSLYQLKFKGRKVLEDISNCLYQRELMLKGR